MNYGLEDLLLSNTSKVFGSKCYIKNNNEHIGKYDDMVDEGIFLGYAANSKWYTCYNMRLHKLVDCIDIKIDEGMKKEYFGSKNISNFFLTVGSSQL